MKMTPDEARLKQQLARHEGYRRHPYRCTAGKLTVGYGRNLEARGIGKRIAGLMLDEDIAHHRSLLLEKFPRLIELGPARQAVLVNMAVNMGVDGLMGFRRMLAAVEVGDFATAAAEMADSRWFHQVGRRSAELVEQMRTGEWPTNA